MKQRISLTLALSFVLTGSVLSQNLSMSDSENYQQLTDVPTVYVETENRQAITSKEDYIRCTFIYVDAGQTTRYENTQIRGRGNSSWWNCDKKSYRVKFEKKQRLLGDNFANAKNWTLLANHGDKTMIRNALTYDLGRFMGMKFCPAAKFVDLYVNGTYGGTYQISDQVQVHNKRVEIDENNGWLLEVANENSKEDPYITSSRYGIIYNIKNPKDETLTLDKRIAIGKWISGFENAVSSDDYMNPQTGYRAFIDEQDFVNWYVAAELTGNIDALYSIYMYKDAGEQKMHFGPLWDLDLGYDNSCERSLLRNMEAFLGLANRPFEAVLQRLWLDLWFARSCNNRLNQLVADGLQQFLLDRIDSLRSVVWQTQAQNFRVWPIDKQVYDWEKHSYYPTYDGYITELKNFIRIHIPYLQQAFAQQLSTGIYSPCLRGFAIPATGRPGRVEPLYDLHGRAVKKPTGRGVFISNRKKYIHSSR
ncbi:MAG: CotH kinase family protein [Prevotella sp.]|nr:CotH kinase family protein [Prevotella sp.]